MITASKHALQGIWGICTVDIDMAWGCAGAGARAWGWGAGELEGWPYYSLD